MIASESGAVCDMWSISVTGLYWIVLQRIRPLSGVECKLREQGSFHEALETIWQVVRAANAYVDQQAPWKLHKEDPARRDTVLYVLCETIRHLGLYIQPFMPDSANAMLNQLAVSSEVRDFTHVGSGSALTPGATFPKPEPVFPRFVEEEDTAA